MKPTEPGHYVAREFSLDMMGTKIFTRPYEVEVVAHIPNPRNHKLLVKTGLKRPPYYKSLDCFDWTPPVSNGERDSG